MQIVEYKRALENLLETTGLTITAIEEGRYAGDAAKEAEYREWAIAELERIQSNGVCRQHPWRLADFKRSGA